MAFFLKLLKRCAEKPENSKRYFGGLFAAMEEGGEFDLTEIAHFNGGLFRLALGRAQAFKALGGPLQLGIESADAEPDQRCFRSVDDSPTRVSRSRLGRFASSSLIVGIATILQ